MLQHGLGTEDGEITAATSGHVGRGSFLFLVVGLQASLRYKQPWLRVAVQREKAPCPLMREVVFELCPKAQPFLSQLLDCFLVIKRRRSYNRTSFIICWVQRKLHTHCTGCCISCLMFH